MFKNVDKQELKVIIQYFQQAGIKMRQIDSDTNKTVEMNDFNSEELDEEIRQSQVEEKKKNEEKKTGDEGVTVGRSGRRRVPVQQPVQLPDDIDDYDDEDDESFGGNADEEGSGDDDDGEDGEEEMEDDIDDEIDKDELKQLKGNKIHDKKDRRKK